MRAGAADEGLWLRAERQTAGRGRQGRAWASLTGNFFGSTVVRLRPGDPSAATLGFVAAVALEAVVTALIRPGPDRGAVVLKWPNDLLIDGAKVSGILLERAEDAVVIGCGVNLAHHPDLPERPTTSLAVHGAAIGPAPFADRLAESFTLWLARWRAEGFAAVRDRWLDRAHPPGTPLRALLPDGFIVEGSFDDLDPDGALILRTSTSLGRAPSTEFGAGLATGERRVIHAGDVFLV